MADVVIAALRGELGETIAEGELAPMMAAEGYEHGSADRLERARALIERSLKARFLRVITRTHQVEAPGQWEEWHPYSNDLYSRHYVAAPNRKSGESGEWVLVSSCMGSSERPPGARSVFNIQTERSYAKRDVAEWLHAMGDDAERWQSKALGAWLGDEKPRARVRAATDAGIKTEAVATFPPKTPEKPLSRDEIQKRYTPQQGGAPVGWHHVFKAIGGARNAKCKVQGKRGLYYPDQLIDDARNAGIELTKQGEPALCDVTSAWSRAAPRHKMER